MVLLEVKQFTAKGIATFLGYTVLSANFLLLLL